MAPEITYIMMDLKSKGFDVDTSALNIDEGVESILNALK